MLTIRQLIDAELSTQPLFVYLLKEGLINVTGLARYVRPTIEKQLGETVSLDTIGMAIRRLQKRWERVNVQGVRLPTANNISIQLDITVVTYGEHVPARIITHNSQYRFFSFAKGSAQSMLAISHEDVSTAIVKHALHCRSGMAAITITLENESPETVGAYAHIPLVLAVAGIPIAEVLSLHNDLTILLGDKHVDRAFQVLRAGLKGKQTDS